MNVIPLEISNRRAANAARDFLDKYHGELASLLAFVAGEKGFETFDDAMFAIEGLEADVPALCEAMDRMSAVLTDACRPGSKWNSLLLWFGGRLTELRYEL